MVILRPEMVADLAAEFPRTARASPAV